MNHEGAQGGAAAAPGARAGRSPLLAISLLIGAVVVVGLPLSINYTLDQVTLRAMRDTAAELSVAITGTRSYYTSHVVNRLRQSDADIEVTHDYAMTPGAIPPPATLSIELGERLMHDGNGISYRLLSDYPFENRADRTIDGFEADAIQRLRKQPTADVFSWEKTSKGRRLRLVKPVLMEDACVACHNSHPLSTRQDWKVGDVRGIQEVVIHRASESDLTIIQAVLLYVAASLLLFSLFAGLVWRQKRRLEGSYAELDEAQTVLAEKNATLERISSTLSRYLSPNVYASLFKGDGEMQVETTRKRLTIFFSDIRDFTETAENLQPEALTSILNEYLSDMSKIAIEHGGTIDKFVGDAMLIFFGDPTTDGAPEDAIKCLNMAVAMQRRIPILREKWRNDGYDLDFRVRASVHTGYCNVGNFGSEARMDYTIIGGAVNLAARLQQVARPGGVVMSAETYELTKEEFFAEPGDAVALKGIDQPVVPYHVVTALDEPSTAERFWRLDRPGLRVFADLERLNDGERDTLRTLGLDG